MTHLSSAAVALSFVLALLGGIGCTTPAPRPAPFDPCDVDRDGEPMRATNSEDVRTEECEGNDCDDFDPNRFPGNPEVCDPAGHDEDCDFTTFGVIDRDSDGVLGNDQNCGGGYGYGYEDDCDDSDATRFPGNTEICDPAGHDEDCNDTTYSNVDGDVDGDGYVSAACCNGTDNCGPDCDDVHAAIAPNGLEVCDGFDNDCNGVTDDGLVVMTYVDEDGDGYGVGEAALRCTDAGYASIGGDCDDTLTEIHPGAFRCANDNASSASIEVCEDDASWTPSSCIDVGLCVPQPDATGVCLPGQPGAMPACSNGLDDDMDGYIDYEQVPSGNVPPDTGCDNPLDNSERGDANSPNQCDNGIDDDMSGLADYPADPGCKSPQSTEPGVN